MAAAVSRTAAGATALGVAADRTVGARRENSDDTQALIAAAGRMTANVEGRWQPHEKETRLAWVTGPRNELPTLVPRIASPGTKAQSGDQASDADTLAEAPGAAGL